ncbi:MAG: rpsK [Parachlamydiales bacterium]|nr:rpsK [Parachlamydiales bacterium]
MSKQEQKAPPKKTGVRIKKKVQRTVPAGIAHVKATFNNTIVSITDLAGNVIAWSSAGKANFAGSRKSSAFAATVAAQNAAREAMGVGMKECEVNLNGPGAGRESAVRGLQSAGLAITIIRDCTPVPHNGCRARKRRRV